jgi:sialic acid synthase SpsE
MIVCEVGLNHLGNEKYSSMYLKLLSNTNCDAITYQIRESKFYKREEYKNYELSFEHYDKLKKSTNKKFGIALSNSDLVTECENIDVDFYKVLSWDLTNYNFIDKLLNNTEKPIYVSTGTSSVEDLDSFFNRYNNNDRINFIHTQLTAKPEDANLRAIPFLKNKYPYGVGFGNHSENLNIILASVPFEPQDIWFYVKGADYDWRYHPDEFWGVPLSDVDSLIQNITIVESSLGSETKTSINEKGY